MERSTVKDTFFRTHGGKKKKGPFCARRKWGRKKREATTSVDQSGVRRKPLGGGGGTGGEGRNGRQRFFVDAMNGRNRRVRNGKKD